MLFYQLKLSATLENHWLHEIAMLMSDSNSNRRRVDCFVYLMFGCTVTVIKGLFSFFTINFLSCCKKDVNITNKCFLWYIQVMKVSEEIRNPLTCRKKYTTFVCGLCWGFFYLQCGHLHITHQPASKHFLV